MFQIKLLLKGRRKDFKKCIRKLAEGNTLYYTWMFCAIMENVLII